MPWLTSAADRRFGVSRRRRRDGALGERAEPPNILVVEDESSIASFVSLYLKNAGYGVRTAATGTDALAQVAAQMPALIVLDLMLPDIDGIEVCKRIRQTSDVPILMLTARDEDVDKIIGLEVGADDYLTKPFNPRELVARVKSILRRATPERRERETEVIVHGDLRVDAGRREVQRRRRGDPARAEGVRPALGAARPSRPRADARPAARARLGLHVRRRHAHGRRPRAPAPPQARRRVADRHRLGRRLQGLAGEGRAARIRRRPSTACHARLAPRPAAARLPRRDPARGRRHDGDRGSALPELRARPGARELRREAHGIAQLYANAVHASYGNKPSDRAARRRSPRRTSSARPATASTSSARTPFPGQSHRPAAAAARRRSTGRPGKSLTFEFTPPGTAPRVPRGREPGRPSTGRPIGAIVVATPKTDVSAPRARR